MRYTLEVLFKDRHYSNVYFRTAEQLLLYVRQNEAKILSWKMHYYGT